MPDSQGRARNRSQSPRGSLDDRRRRQKPHERLLSYRVITLATLLRRSASRLYRRKLRLSQVEWSVLALVGEHAPLSLNELSELVGLDKGQLSRGVSDMVERGLISREPRGAGRGVAIRLTPRGARTYDKLIDVALTRNELLLRQLSEAERRALFKSLDLVTHAARTMLQKEQDTRA